MNTSLRYDWTEQELQEIHDLPLLQLIDRARSVHLQHHDPYTIDVCRLISIKTGGCPEDCRYCAQSSRYQTFVTPERSLDKEEVLKRAADAKASGASRICLSVAQRDVKEGAQFEKIREMISSIKEMGLSVCCTLGMMTEDQAQKLKEAGLTYYNHNLDTSERYYPEVVTTRTYHERIKTLDAADKAGLKVCSGGILGLGETKEDRLQLILTFAKRRPHPASVPVNSLVPIEGTPFAHREKIPLFELVRFIATARIAMPSSMIRLSAGRESLSKEAQALCFLAGANSIFQGNKLLTVQNRTVEEDAELMRDLGLKGK
ncbi:biotin synthase BioB [Estrella lausannensis]|uniref:Biotin synthase n=1 Tax=Estrella lausannensis TaxID=483423 RepID=A0A0H5E6H2_9BACT|nr:biotin synthase BioB [Estrella lausannensis]CRX38880.1 Biotin synthase [Estrella lausannensis]